jgi:hypothetical protein
MFETHETARLPSFSANDGEYLWSHVGIHLQHAWFQVTYRIRIEDDFDISETLLLSDANQLIELTKRVNIKITFVDLVSPGYINGSDRWRMDPLREIWLCASDKWPNQQEHVFVLANGTQYRGIWAASSEDEFHEDRLIFSTDHPT